MAIHGIDQLWPMPAEQLQTLYEARTGKRAMPSKNNVVKSAMIAEILEAELLMAKETISCLGKIIQSHVASPLPDGPDLGDYIVDRARWMQKQPAREDAVDEIPTEQEIAAVLSWGSRA